MNTKIIKLDINNKMYETITAKQGDTESRFLLFHLFDASLPFDLTEKSVRVYGIKPDGTKIFNDLVINDVKKGYCTLKLTNQMLAISGLVKLELVIYSGNKKLSSIPFMLNVISSLNSDDAVVSTNEFTSLMNGLAALSEYDIYKSNAKQVPGIKEEVSNLSSQLDTKASQIELEVERKRIDSFTSLSEGSTTGDAELLDARIGADAFVYDNLGSAIRLQFDRVYDEKVDKADLFAFNLLIPATITENKYCEYGVIKDYTGWNVTDYIRIDNTKQYSLFIFNSNNEKDYLKNVYVDQFDANKKYISDSSLKGSKLSDMTFTNETEYIRVSGPSVYMSANGVITLTEHEDYINSFINYNTMIDLKENRISNIENNIYEMSNVKPLLYNNIRSICRIGYDVYNSETPPQQSIESFKMAYAKGFRILLCDLRFTSDNVPVLHHDNSINTYAKNIDGTNISNTVTIAGNTYSTLQNYDYGIYKSDKYKGTKIMHLKDMLKLCRKLGVELYIEVKSMNEEQAKITCNLVKMYAMENKTSWSGTSQQMQYVINNIDIARVSTMPQNIQDSTINHLVNLKTGKNKVFFFAWDTTQLTKELVQKLIKNDIEFEIGTLDTEDDILNYFKQDDVYYYCTGISSNKIVAGKVILENEIL